MAGAIIGVLYTQLRGGACRAFSSDLRVRVEACGLSTYPVAALVCGPLERSSKDANAVVNPTVVFEVLSPSTEVYDREEKRLHYQQIPGLRAIVLVQSTAAEVEVWRRGERAFRQEVYGPTEVVPLGDDLELDVAELYRALPPEG